MQQIFQRFFVEIFEPYNKMQLKLSILCLTIGAFRHFKCSSIIKARIAVLFFERRFVKLVYNNRQAYEILMMYISKENRNK